MRERPYDKSKKCGKVISDLERFSWNSCSMYSKLKTHLDINGNVNSHKAIGNMKGHEGLQG